MNITIQGLQEIQRANLKMLAAIKPAGGLGRALKYATAEAERYAVAISHVDTGAMKASHRIKPDGNSRFIIYLDPAAKNPRTGERTSNYGPAEHARGGEHAFYARTIDEQGQKIGLRAMNYLIGELP